jgi:hypothetical protein
MKGQSQMAKVKPSVKSNSVLTVCIGLIIYVANGIRLSIGSSEISSWSLTELLINYQGGFVRRGIFGELVFNTSNPIYYATLFQKLALVFVLIGLILILFLERSSISRIFFTATLIFAPGGMHDMKEGGNFPGGEWEYLDRKEIWFYAALIIFYFLIKFLSEKPIIFTAIFTLVSVVTILHHELFVIFSLTTYTVLILSKKLKFKSLNSVLAGIYYLSVSATFYLVNKFHGDGEVAYIIWYSYQAKYSDIVTDFGAIGSISWSIADSHSLAIKLINEGSVLYYIYFAAISILFLLIYTITKFRTKTSLGFALLLNAGILIGCVLTSYVFLDAGRLISMYTFITLISLNILSESLKKSTALGDLRFETSSQISELFQKNFIIFFLVGYLIFISLITRVNHCCPQPNEIPLRSFLGLLN